MKRKNKGPLPPAKQSKVEHEAAEATPQFLQGVKCHVHPASFGMMRHNIFKNHVTRYGGELVSSLPEASEATYHVVFEESMDERKLKSLVDISTLPNSVFLRCTWLVESIKIKAKAGTEKHLIVPLNSLQEHGSNDKLQKSDELTFDQINRKMAGETDKINLEERDLTKADAKQEHRISGSLKKTDELLSDQTYKKVSGEKDQTNLGGRNTTKSDSQSSDCNSGLNEYLEVQSTSTGHNAPVRICDHVSTPDREDISNQTSGVVIREGIETEPEKSTVDEATRWRGGEDRTELLKRPFPKQLQEKFACARPSSSKPPDLNAHITSELQKLAVTYKNKNDTWRAVGYERAITAIRNYSKQITSREEALAIPGIGGRLADKIVEILESGRLRKVAEVCEGEEAETLRLFLGVWGAGPTTAQSWYMQDFRTLEDLRTKATLNRHQQIGLKHYHDINSRIPRSEVAEIECHVREATLRISKGAEVTVCGSYRRGKVTCGDVDVLITHPDGHSHELIFKPLLAGLRDTGFLTDDLVTQEDNGNQKKYLGVCKLPGEGRKHRRLDVIVVPYNERAPALMYFTGSAHFNRSMRLLATKKGMSLSEHSLRVGVIRQGGEKLNEGCVLETPTEESIFTHLGLEYRPPQERDH